MMLRVDELGEAKGIDSKRGGFSTPDTYEKAVPRSVTDFGQGLDLEEQTAEVDLANLAWRERLAE